MIRKSITLLLISIAFAFANISMLEDSEQDPTIASIELSNIYDNIYNPFNVLFLGGIGFTSSKRIEIDVICMSAYDMGRELFGSDRLLTDFTLLRLDSRLERTEGDKTISEISYGSIISSLIGYAFLGIAPSKESVLAKIGLGVSWLSSGTTKYILYGNNLSGVALAESHAIEWFLRTEEKDKKCHYSAKEFGFIEEIGIQFGIMFAQATAGISFEITNKQRNVGWFLKIVTLPIPIDSFPRKNEQPQK